MTEEDMAVLQDEAAFNAYCLKHTGLKYGPFVRASTYRNYQCDYRHDVGESFDHSEPRRPVVMRGARRRIISKYQAKSHYPYHVAIRFLERSRINIVTNEGVMAIREAIENHFERRGIYVHDRYNIWPSYTVGQKDHWGQTVVFLNGKPKFVEFSNLPGLQSRLRKAKQLGDWDLPHVMQRLDDLCFERRKRQYHRLRNLTLQFQSLLRIAGHKRPEKADFLIKTLFSERI